MRLFSLMLILVPLTSFSQSARPKPSRGLESAPPEHQDPAGAKSLEDVFQAALQRSDDVAISQEQIRQAEQTYRQAIGAVMPNLSGYGTYQYQQENPNAGYNNLYPNPSTATRLTVTQPLFQGFKEFAGFHQTKSLVSASKHDKQQAMTLLYQDCAQAYFNVVASENDVENLDRELGYYDERIKETETFKKIGRSQYSDVLTLRAQRATLNAQRAQVISALRAQREVLVFLTGWGPDAPLAHPHALPGATHTLEEYLAQVDQRPDVQGDQARLKAAEEGIPIARAGHFPTLGLTGDYYLQRTGPLNGVSFDAMLTLTVPIFAGFTVDAQVQEATSKRDQAEFQVSKTKRAATQQIRTFWQAYQNDKLQLDAFAEANDLSEKSFREQSRQYKYGLVTNLDVLTSLTNFIENERSLDKVRHAVQLDIENLETAAAFRPGQK